MYGFKPQHARGKPVQNFADGGIVHSIKGALGLRPKTPEELLAADAKRMEQNREAAAAIAERTRKAQPAPQQQNAISGYAGMSANQRREKELGLKDGGVVPRGFKPGGLIRGPGTGTSDSIETEKEPGTFIMPADSTEAIGPDALEDMGETVPVRLSNGEFELPPEQVQALGEAVLTVMRNATHQAAGGAQKAPTSNGFAPAQHFASGGVVKDEEKQRMERNAQTQQGQRGYFPNNSPDAGADIYGGVGPANGFGSSGKLATGADKVIAAQPPVQQPVLNARPAPAPQQRAVAAPAPAAAPLLAPAEPVAQGNAATPLGQMHSIGARSGAQMVADGARSGAQSFFDSFQKAPMPAAVPSAAPAGLPGYKTDVQRGGGNVPAIDTAAPTATAPPAPAAAPGPGDVTRVGNSYSGTNVSGDITVNGKAPRSGGQISAQNMAAADGLAARSQQESIARLGAQQPAGFTPSGVQAPTVRHSGNDWQARNDLRNALVSASSITNNGGKWDNHGKGNVSPERAAYLAMLGTDSALRQAQPGADVAAMRENAGIQREDMQQTGATTRTGMTEQGANAREAGRNALMRDEFGLKKEAAGFQTRAAKRLEDLQTRYEAETDPAKRADLAKQLREIQGKEQTARYKVAAGGQQIDANGVAYKVPDRVFNEQTGEFADGRGAAAPAPIATPKAGEVRNGYRFKGGNPNDQANWTKV